ncbi:ZIP family metal transporter [Eudoraea adriatica]|uniref:ZIP family metal transporter n=1 Tax=Eudoraea adriatica TaxID=446681 RepID=UPI00037B8EFA|nr:hypothetical protein [Eudoraea adriatica]
MFNVFLIGLLSSSSLIIGGVLASRFTLEKRMIGIIMGFGAGTLISAVSYELIFEAVQIAKRSGFPAYGFFSGALTFLLADWLIGRFSFSKTQKPDPNSHTALIVPMILAIILDGIPESIVLGLGIFEYGSVSLSMLVAIFISNLPEAIAGSVGMKEGGWSRKKIIILWFGIALFCAVATLLGFTLFSNISPSWMAFINAYAGGAILMMLANSMIPEAYENGGKLAGVFTILGFFVSVSIVILENS